MSHVQKKIMPIWFKIIVIFSVIALVGVTIGILFTERWVGVVANQLQELNEGTIEKAYYRYTSKDFQVMNPFDKFQSFINAHPILFNKPSTHFVNRSLHRNISTLKGKLTDEHRKVFPIEYRLIKEDGQWKILSIDFVDTTHSEPPPTRSK